MKPRHFVDLADISAAGVAQLLQLAADIESSPAEFAEVLKGKNLGLIFLNSSVRTLASFQAGMAQLGGSTFVVSPGQGSWDMETEPGVVMDGDKAEHLDDAIGVLEQYADALGLRCFAQGERLQVDLADPILNAALRRTQKPLINMESALLHPCQSLADWKTLEDLKLPRKSKFVLSWAPHPKALPLAVPNSTLCMAAQRGMDVTVLSPQEFRLPQSMIAKAQGLAAVNGGSVNETDQIDAALEGATVVYAKAWQQTENYGGPHPDVMSQDATKRFRVDESWFEATQEDARFMHCMPIRRNVVATDAVLDSPRNAMFRQAGNRLHAQKAVLCRVMNTVLDWKN